MSIACAEQIAAIEMRSKFDRLLAIYDFAERQLLGLRQIQGYKDWLLERARGKTQKSWLNLLGEAANAMIDSFEMLIERYRKEFVEMEVAQLCKDLNIELQDVDVQKILKTSIHPDSLDVILANLIAFLGQRRLKESASIAGTSSRPSLCLSFVFRTDECRDRQQLEELKYRIFETPFYACEPPDLCILRIKMLVTMMGAMFHWEVDETDDQNEILRIEFPCLV